MEIELKARQMIVKGGVADFAILTSKNNEVGKEDLKNILREIADEI